MTNEHTEKRIEVVTLLAKHRNENETTGDVLLRGLRALDEIGDVEQVRNEWCAEYVNARDAVTQCADIAQYIAAHFLGANCDDAALNHAKAIRTLTSQDQKP